MWLETLWSQPQCSYLWMEIKETLPFFLQASVLNSTNIIVAIKTSVCVFRQADMINTSRMTRVPPVAAGYMVTISACCDQGDRVLSNRCAQGYKSINGPAKIRIEEDAEALEPSLSASIQYSIPQSQVHVNLGNPQTLSKHTCKLF